MLQQQQQQLDLAADPASCLATMSTPLCAATCLAAKGSMTRVAYALKAQAGAHRHPGMVTGQAQA